MAIEVDGKILETDNDGFLIDRSRWNDDVARALARHDSNELTPAHWDIIRFLRDYYAEYRLIPPMRLLTKAIEKHLGPTVGNSRHLHRLFPDGVAKQGSRYAGLPKPPHCI